MNNTEVHNEINTHIPENRTAVIRIGKNIVPMMTGNRVNFNPGWLLPVFR